MAVQILKAPLLEKSSYNISGGVYKSSYTWKFEVAHPPQFPLDSLPEVVFSAYAPVMPVEGAPHPFVPWAYCDSIATSHITGGFYECVVTYTDKNSDSGTDGRPGAYGKQENPLLDLPETTPIAGLKSFPIYKDVNDEAILNAIGDPLIDEAERQVFGFKIKKNVVQIPSWVESLIDSKSDRGLIIKNYFIEAGAARFILPDGFISLPKRRNGYEYIEFQFEIRVDHRDNHDGKLLNGGFFELQERLDDSGNPVAPPVLDRVAIKFPDGSEPNEAVPLSTETLKRIVNPTPANVEYVTTKRYREASGYQLLPGVEEA
jgi:hypothetical protein